MNENGQPLGLKWHKFLIYFSLWIGALSLFAVAFAVGKGIHYMGIADRVYEAFPVMGKVDVAYAVCIALIGVYHIYVRFQLAGFKVGAPQKLLALHLITGVVPVIYALATSIVTGVSFGVGDLQTLWPALVAFAINRYYYNNRKDLFVN